MPFQLRQTWRTLQQSQGYEQPTDQPTTAARRHLRPTAATPPPFRSGRQRVGLFIVHPACTCGATASRPRIPRVAASRRLRPHSAGESPTDDATREAVFRGMLLNPGTRTAIARMNISDPTPIQEQSIPPLLEGRDLIGQARTGSGKTLAFAVPLVEQCDATAPAGCRRWSWCRPASWPSQVGGVVEDLAGSQGLHVTLLYGGRSVGKDHRALQRGAQIIIGTPGRTLDHVRQGSLNLRSVRFLVLDEADEMLDRGFARDVDAILSQTPTQRQTALFSATVPDWVAQTAQKHLHDPVTVAVDADLETLPTVEHLVYSIQKTDKMDALRTLLDRRDGAPVLVFGKTKHGVKRLAQAIG